jgi:hypothetical protein
VAAVTNPANLLGLDDPTSNAVLDHAENGTTRDQAGLVIGVGPGFVAGRDAQGKVKDWEYHGMGCEVCIDIGEDSMRMFNSGASVDAIRKAIDAKYVMPGRPHTPTPMPPGRKGHGH